MATAPVSRRQIIGLPAGHLKDASGAAIAAGLRPVLDLPGRSPQTLAAAGKQETLVTHAPAQPAETTKPQVRAYLTRRRSFRDE
jgi:hypothetical protein